MKRDALKRFVCLGCRGELAVAREDASDEVLEGLLSCRSCGMTHEISMGIPRFVDGANYAESFGYQWNIHAKTQLDSETGLSITRDRVAAVTRWPTSLAGETILEAGCGPGRFTEILQATGAEVFSFDYSTAVDANRRNHGAKENLHLFQGDIYAIPFKPSGFDKVFCLGVLQHTPDPEAAFRCLAEQVRPGGEMVVDVYAKTLPGLLQWKYLLRPITKQMQKERLYNLVARTVDALLPLAKLLRRIGGRAGARLVPILEYSHLGVPPQLNREMAVLDTFDMYSPAHDHPQSISTVRRWFADAGFERVFVGRGPNGIVGRGVRPL